MLVSNEELKETEEVEDAALDVWDEDEVLVSNEELELIM